MRKQFSPNPCYANQKSIQEEMEDKLTLYLWGMPISNNARKLAKKIMPFIAKNYLPSQSRQKLSRKLVTQQGKTAKAGECGGA